CRLDHEQESRLVGGDDEGVGDVSRPVDERPCGRDDRLTAYPERQLTREDEEPLVLVAVDVERRPVPAWCPVLDDGDAPTRRLTRGLDRREAPEKPAGFALSLRECDRHGGGDLRHDRSF